MSCIHSQLPNIFYLISGTNSFQSILTKCLLVIPCPLLSHSFMATTKVRGCHELTNSLLLPEEDIIPRTEEQQLLTHHVSKSCFASFFWSWPYPPSSFRAAWVLELVDLLPKIWKFNFFFLAILKVSNKCQYSDENSLYSLHAALDLTFFFLNLLNFQSLKEKKRWNGIFKNISSSF